MIYKAPHEIIAASRKRLGLTMRELSVLTEIDQALLSKYENGKRLPSEKHSIALEKALEMDKEELKKTIMSEKVAQIVAYEANYQEILIAAESRVEYLSSRRAIELPIITYDLTKRLETIDALKDKWNSLKPLDEIQLKKMEEYFKVKYTYESNKIEGNTLTYQETHLVINEGLTIGGKPVADHLEAINHSDAVDFVKDLVLGKEEITQRILLEIHYLVLKGVNQANAGEYRQVPVRISGSEHVPPQPFQLDVLMEGYFDQYRIQKKRVHPVILAAEMHERLVSIHPFVDGNGRTSRLVMNLILLKNGYTVTSLKGDDASRLRYYKALEGVQVNNDSTAFYTLILDCLEASLREHLEMV